MARSTHNEPIANRLIEDVCAQFLAGKRVRQKLPEGGMIYFDRPLPFLCVYRRNTRRPDPGTGTLISDQAAYLTLPGAAPVRRGLARLIRRLAETASQRFGAFFIIELWASADEEVPKEKHPVTAEPTLPAPRFRIHERAPTRPGPSVNELIFALKQIQLHRQPACVQVVMRGRAHPPEARQLISNVKGEQINTFLVGLEVLPVWREPDSGSLYPDVLRQLRQGVGLALKRAFFTFARKRTNMQPQHYYALGRRRLPQSVWQVDHELASIGTQFDLLLQATPINVEASWQEFAANRFQQDPNFDYRPLAVDPLLLKRQVNLVRTERITDTAVAHLMRQTQDELDRTITMLGDIGTAKFLPGSIQVFGAVEPSLRQMADELLASTASQPSTTKNDRQLDARVFAEQAEKEIRNYRRQDPRFQAQVEIRDDLFSGLMASAGNLLIGRETSIPANRAEALIAHEIGTHLVTYYNGQAQPLRLLAIGLAGYDAFQEGIAVFFEYLVGGLTRGRLRLLAARVVACDQMLRGDSFSQVFQRLHETHKFDPRQAYTVAMRVYRGGGLTKDAVYLRGLAEILEFLANGGDFSLAFTGKMAAEHAPIVRELLYREVLVQPPLVPRPLSAPAVRERIERSRRGLTLMDLIPAAT